MKQLVAIMQREFRHELRSRRSWLAILLYIGSTVYISYLGFQHNIEPLTWNALFWILIIFVSMFSASGSFSGREGEMLYIYTLVPPVKFIMARLLYNGLFMLVISVMTLFIYSLFMNNPVGSFMVFLATLLLAVWGISSLLTMSYSIAIKGGGSFTLMAVLSFPLLIPMLIIAQHLSMQSLQPEPTEYAGNLASLAALDALVAAMCYLLFPYLWRD